MSGAEQSQFSWTGEKLNRKPPAKRILHKTVDEVQELPITETTAESTSSNLLTNSALACDDFIDTSFETPQTEADPILELQAKIAALETSVVHCQQKLKEAAEENAILVRRQFSLNKIKHDNSAILFYTGFPSYEALIGFFNYIRPKIPKMQYWKGENSLKESQLYQTDDNKNKPGPSRKLPPLEEFLLVLMRLKAGLFVQDLANRFGISISSVSRICITWINFLYYELKDLFPFPSQDLVRKNMPKEFAQYPTTRIILDCNELFIQRPSAMLAQSETWSDYKHHNTWKLLVGITPNGQVTFLSQLWGGRVSDKQTTRESGVLELLEAGDNVMVDQGFDIAGIVPNGVAVNMPPFLAGREQMTAAETELPPAEPY